MLNRLETRSTDGKARCNPLCGKLHSPHRGSPWARYLCRIVPLFFAASGATPLLASPAVEPSVRKAAKKKEKKEKKARRNLPVALTRYTFFGEAQVPSTVGGESRTLATHMLRAQVQFGHYFRKSGTVFAGAVGFDHMQLAHRTPSGGFEHLALHYLSLRLVLGQRITRRWMLLAFARPGVSSDFQGFHRRDVRLSAGALARFSYRRNLSFGFGVLYNNGVFGHLVLPVLNLKYRGRTGRVQIRFPYRYQFWLTPHPAVEVGLDLRVVSSLFRLHRESVLGDTLSLLYITAGPAVRFVFLGGIFTQLSAGYAARYLQLYQSDERTHRALDFRGWYASVTLGYLI